MGAGEFEEGCMGVVLGLDRVSRSQVFIGYEYGIERARHTVNDSQ